MTAKWSGSAWTIAPLPTIRLVGAGGQEHEEKEEAEEVEPPNNSLDARLERVITEPDHEREEIFRYLKDFRRQKRLRRGPQRREQVREEMRAEWDRMLREDAERSAKR